MKIYVVNYFWDNGESYEDYREYTSYHLFSSLRKAESYYYLHVVEEYEGRYSLIEWELDTQEKRVLDQSPYRECSPSYSNYDDYDSPDPEYDYDPEDWCPGDPCTSIEKAWEFIDWDNRNLVIDDDVDDDNAWVKEYEAFCEECSLNELHRELNTLLADSYAKKFCEEWNETDDILLRHLIIMPKYDKKFEELGFPKAWEAYKRLINVL